MFVVFSVYLIILPLKQNQHLSALSVILYCYCCTVLFVLLVFSTFFFLFTLSVELTVCHHAACHVMSPSPIRVVS